MTNLKVALLQLESPGMDLDASLSKGDQFCLLAKEREADIALFPEMWSIGYEFPDPGDQLLAARWRATAIDFGHEYFMHFKALARQLEIAIALTYLQNWQEKPRNVVSLIDGHGEVLFTYAKVHTCDFDKEAMVIPGDRFYCADLEVRTGVVRVGAMICFDREFPESARVLMLQGAEIILTPNACDLEHNRIRQFGVRAFENMLGVAMANYAPPKGNGHSVAFDAIAFDEDGASRDTRIMEAGENEGVYIAEFDMERIRAYRSREVWGDAYRKPAAYLELVTKEVLKPFQRDDSRRRLENAG